MNKTFIGSFGLALVLMAPGLTTPAQTIVYQNNQSVIYSSGQPVILSLLNGDFVGSTITLDPSTSSQRDMVGFSFQYFAHSTTDTSFTGTPTLNFKLYNNNGPNVNGVPSPGSLPFYTSSFSLDSTYFSLATPVSGGYGVVGNVNFTAGDFLGGSVALPSDILTWTVQVSGLGTGDQFGLVAFNPGAPGNVGTSADYYWQNIASSWNTYTNSVVPGANSFGAQVVATPEPSTLTLAAFGGIALLAAYKRRQTK